LQAFQSPRMRNTGNTLLMSMRVAGYSCSQHLAWLFALETPIYSVVGSFVETRLEGVPYCFNDNHTRNIGANKRC
jgi:hypothetical protein